MTGVVFGLVIISAQLAAVSWGLNSIVSELRLLRNDVKASGLKGKR
jgi:hypothetical protein